MWAMEWNREEAEFAIPEAVKHGIDFLEITMAEPELIDVAHTGAVLERHELECVCSLGLPLDKLPTDNPNGAIDFVKRVIDKADADGAKALSGVIYGGRAPALTRGVFAGPGGRRRPTYQA
ncbi:hypothetical protein [Martelella soudanensis]|uniref:hypothetical protein n=1 Tax=unclassified Martelella TaxID=2629616 RepID=UPI0015DFB97D|nr:MULTISPECIES: hypothetical protein [unclassified Martelella]